MEERFKQRDKQKGNLNLNQKPQFKGFELKTKETELLKRLESVDFASHAKYRFNQKIDIRNAEAAQEIKIKSTSDDLKVGFEGVEGTRSGFFFAKTLNGNKLLARLEDEADKANPNHTFNGTGTLRTHIVPLGKIGDTAVFKVIDQTTGDEAQASAVTVPLGAAGLVGFIKNLFR